GPPGTPPADRGSLWDVPTGRAIAALLALSAIFHVIIASPERSIATEGLAQGHTYFRWVEYSLSSSLMIVIIAQLVGISDVVALLALFGVIASMIFFGWLQEKYHQAEDCGWLPSSSVASPAQCRGSASSSTRS